MRRTMSGVLAVGLLFASVAAADEAAQAVIDKAVKAAGGLESLTKFKAAHWKGKGKFFGFGEGIDYVGEWWQQLPGQMKTVIDAEFGGMKIQNVRIVSGDKAWATNMGTIEELDKEQLSEAHQALHYDRVVVLWPLRDKGFELTALGESMVEKQPALGVKVSFKGRRDVQLFFDKDSGLLVKASMKVKDQGTGGQEVEQEMYYSGHKNVQGRMVPMKAVIKREGTIYIEAEITEYERLENLDDKVFTKPQ